MLVPLQCRRGHRDSHRRPGVRGRRDAAGARGNADLSELFTIANRPDLTDAERLTRAQSLCTARYLQAHPLAVAAEGGLVGVPRNINKNFKAWREGPNVWICPTNRIGPVYQFVFENGNWRFDGPVGILRLLGRFRPDLGVA